MRTLDALHLAAALPYGQEMLTTDSAMAQAAQLVGVKCRLVR